MAEEPAAALRREVEAQRTGKKEEERSAVAAFLAATVIGIGLAAALFGAVVLLTAFVAVTYKVAAMAWNWIL